MTGRLEWLTLTAGRGVRGSGGGAAHLGRDVTSRALLRLLTVAAYLFAATWAAVVAAAVLLALRFDQ